jgi:hypothetical protein
MKTMTMAARSRWLVASAALVVAGCGNPDPGSVDSYINSLAVESCRWEFRCCTDAEITQQEMGKFKDEATCVKFRELSMQTTLYAERLAVRQGRIKVDNDNANACLAAAMAKQCAPKAGSPAPTPTAPGTVDPCTLVFKGNTAVGDPCEFANECIKGAHCVSTGAGTHGVCVPYQEEKDICNTSADCDPSVFNLYCAKQDFQCHLRSPVGGACAYTIDPASSMPVTPLLLECDNSTGQIYCDSASSTCKALPASGEACLTAPRPPGVPACAAGLQCDMPAGMGSGTCRGPGAVGDDCTRIACQTTLYCDRTLTPNVCKTLPSVGEQCSQASNYQCAKPYYCNTTMAPPYLCAQPAALNQSCAGGIRCDTGLYCDTAGGAPATCKSQLADGSMCTSSTMCLSGLCSGGVGGLVCTPTQVTVQCTGR